MRIPNARTDKYYNQKYLRKEDERFLRGYDFATEVVLESLFHNLDFIESDYIEKFFNEPLPESMQGERYLCIDSFQEEPTMEERPIRTYGEYIYAKVLEWIELDRDELVTSMIDGYDEEEYERLRKEKE